MIIFLLYDCGIELLDSLPVKILSHPTVKNDLRRRKKKSSEVLLDLAVHQSALQSKEQINRGRIDIVHHCILQFLFSNMIHPSRTNSHYSKPQLLIHSINDTFFEVLPSWRPPTHFLRFRGLLEQLYTKKFIKVSSEEEIILKNGSIDEIIRKTAPKTILLFTSHSNTDPLSLQSFSNIMVKSYKSSETILCLIGGYQHGSPSKQFLINLQNHRSQLMNITLSGGRLPSWKVLNLALASIEWSLSI